MKCHLAIRALEFLHDGHGLFVGDQLYRMTENGDLTIVVESSQGNIYYMRADYSIGQWLRLISSLPDSGKTQVLFQIGIKA